LSESATPMVQVDALTLVRGRRPLFSDVCFRVNAGALLALRGPNGVGKTSLLRLIAGLTQADAGTIRVNGEPVGPLALTCRENTLYQGHANALKDDFSAEENLLDQLALDANPVGEGAVHKALEDAGLAARRGVLARHLSQGQKRRVGLARLLLSAADQPNGKPIWLLDEPTNALDASGVALFLQIVDAHLAAGGCALIASHLPLEVAGRRAELNMQAAA
jgi:heme exporter protein A